MNIEKRKKIEKNVRKFLNEFLNQELHDDDNIFGIINISDIILSPDLSYLDIKVSSFKNQDTLCKILAKYAYLIQRYLGKEIGLRKTPKVRFRYDNSGEISTEVNTVIGTIDKEIKKYEEKNI